MISKYELTAIICLSCCLFTMERVSAYEFPNVTFGLALNHKNMDLKIRDRSFTPTFNTLGLLLSGNIDRFNLTLAYDKSIDDDIESDPSGLIFYSRQDTSLELSYLAARQLRISIGYRTGETESYYSAAPSDSFGTSEKGYFIRGNYEYGFGKKGTLSTSLAIAQLEGEVSLREPFVDTSAFVVGPPPPKNIEGDALGYSFGLRWTGPISDETYYTLGWKLHRYEFDDAVVYGGLDLSYEQNFDIYSLGLIHRF